MLRSIKFAFKIPGFFQLFFLDYLIWIFQCFLHFYIVSNLFFNGVKIFTCNAKSPVSVAHKLSYSGIFAELNSFRLNERGYSLIGVSFVSSFFISLFFQLRNSLNTVILLSFWSFYRYIKNNIEKCFYKQF